MKNEKHKFQLGDLIEHDTTNTQGSILENASNWRQVSGLGFVCRLPNRAQPWYLVHLSDGRRLHFDEDEIKKASK